MTTFKKERHKATILAEMAEAVSRLAKHLATKENQNDGKSI